MRLQWTNEEAGCEEQLNESKTQRWCTCPLGGSILPQNEHLVCLHQESTRPQIPHLRCLQFASILEHTEHLLWLCENGGSTFPQMAQRRCEQWASSLPHTEHLLCTCESGWSSSPHTEHLVCWQSESIFPQMPHWECLWLYGGSSIPQVAHCTCMHLRSWAPHTLHTVCWWRCDRSGLPQVMHLLGELRCVLAHVQILHALLACSMPMPYNSAKSTKHEEAPLSTCRILEKLQSCSARLFVLRNRPSKLHFIWIFSSFHVFWCMQQFASLYVVQIRGAASVNLALLDKLRRDFSRKFAR